MGWRVAPVVKNVTLIMLSFRDALFLFLDQSLDVGIDILVPVEVP